MTTPSFGKLLWLTLSKLLSSAVVGLLNPILKHSQIAKHMGLIGRIFQVIDPIVAQNFGSISSSELYKIVHWSAVSISDTVLTEAELHDIVSYVLEKFDIGIALDKSLPPSKDPQVWRQEIDQAVAQFQQEQERALSAMATTQNTPTPLPTLSAPPLATSLPASRAGAAALLGTTPASTVIQ